MSEEILVCDLVEYGLDSFGQKPQRWRVTHYLKRIEDKLDKEIANQDFLDEIMTKLALKWRENDRENRIKLGLPATRRYKLLYCRPEEATHLSLVSICGAEAPIEKCKKVGTVNWSDEFIAENRANAVSDFWLKNNFCHDWYWE